ncbi:MAG: prepilin-type N-terminal cleavage/methylation domain-containing protein [Caldisericota bacterium]|nr:prepilin-type N-terminal cleavage/methylation domain-containing protein [Caldisericota bacterium]
MMQDLAINRKRKGFTLVELVVAVAVFLVIIALSFSTLSRFFSMRSAYEQEMIFQQNFRFALDKMSYDFRQANKDPGDTSITSLILEPEPNSMGEKLSFIRYDGTNMRDIYYLIKPHGDSYAIYREEYQHGATQGVDPISTQPITEDLHQLVKVYFVRAGGKIIMIAVGKLDYFGKERTISFTSLVFSRNSGYEIPPSP